MQELDPKAEESLAILPRIVPGLGYATPQLHVHIRYALNAGATRQEIFEVIIQTAPFVGFPAVINALKVAHEVCPPA